jgi:Lipid A 3-O-deacylase (PagL)
MVECRPSVHTWLHPFLRACLQGRLGSLQRLATFNLLMVVIKPRHLTSMMVTIMFTGMFSSLAWAEAMTIVSVGPATNTPDDLSFRHAQSGLIMTLAPWLALSTLGDALSIDVGTGPAFFSNYKFGGQDFGGPVQIVGSIGAGFNMISSFFAEYRLQHFSDAGAYGPYKGGVNMHVLEINFRF